MAITCSNPQAIAIYLIKIRILLLLITLQSYLQIDCAAISVNRYIHAITDFVTIQNAV